MSDKRRKDHAKPDKVRIAIITILKQKPLQAKFLREALKKKGKQYKFSRDRLNDILNQLMDKGDLTRIVLDNNQYSVYAVTNKSKILAEIQGDYFQASFKNNMILNEERLLKEFQSAKHKRNFIDSLMQFFGFYVLGSLLMSYTIKKEKDMTNEEFEDFRQEWLSPILDLQRGNPISDYFDKLLGNNEKVLKEMVFILSKEYKLSMSVLGNCAKEMIKNNQNLKELSKDTFSKDVIDKLKERNKK